MKKLLAILLVLVMATMVVACGKQTQTQTPGDTDGVVETNPQDAEGSNEEQEAEEEKTSEGGEQQQEGKPSAKPENKPETKPEPNTSTTPEQKPQTQPETTPAPEADKTPAKTTLGNTLLADFKAKANSGMSAQAIAEALVTNPAIKFSGAAMPVEEGLLSGFGNTEIKGFKSGAMFAPMIGSIPFIGYVFELEDAGATASFISTLKSNADLRWNVCVAADEMVAGSAGNKVFFVMCPTSLED